MKSLIKDNPVAIALLGLSGLLLLAILLMPIVGSGVPEVGVDNSAVQVASINDIVDADSLEPVEKFAVIKQRPLFNHNRKPIVVKTDDALDSESSLADDSAENNPLDADLTGVIITKDQRIAMLMEHSSKATISAAEGDQLEGDLSNWSLEKVNARKVSLKNQRGETAELELVMFTDSLGKPPGGNAQAKNKANGKAGQKRENNEQANAGTAEAKNRPMTAADFMRANLEKRKAAAKAAKNNKASSAKNDDG